MADFCKECSKRLFGQDFGDLAGLCKPGERAHVLCEGCGKRVWVDHTGTVVADEENCEDHPMANFDAGCPDEKLAGEFDSQN